MGVKITLRMGFDTDHREHCMISGKDAGCHARPQLATDPLREVVQIKKLFFHKQIPWRPMPASSIVTTR
jgi:hypothetical protein